MTLNQTTPMKIFCVRHCGNVTENLREVCISMGIDHFRNKANEYPETKREYSRVNRFLNPSAFTCVLPYGEGVTRD